MPKDFKFDPTTQDLVPDGKGAWQLTEAADTMVQLQLQCHAGECWQDEQLGSRLHDLRAFQRRPEVLVADEAKRALGVIVARGRIGNLEVVSQQRNAGRVDVATKFRDTSTGQLVTVKTGG